MADAKLLSEPKNYAVVQLPGRAFPGVVFQGDSLHALIADLRAVSVETDAEERTVALSELIDQLSGVQRHYERVLLGEGMPLPYPNEAAKPVPVAQIIATNIPYYHLNDEHMFFEWLDRMPFVQHYYGAGRDLFIELNRMPTDADLWQIIGFCRRYGVEMTQLAQFAADENRHWFCDAEMYFHAQIFGPPPAPVGSGD